MFWFEYRRADGSTYVSKAGGLTPGEREAAFAHPSFVREFQGDKYGKEYGKG
jgi:hypothetical protein